MKGSARFRQRLKDEQRRVAQRLRALGGPVPIEESEVTPGRNTPYSNPIDEMAMHERREVAYATRSLLFRRATEIAEAFRRLEEGTYGECEGCEGAIAPARLEAMPEVRLCVRCQEAQERDASRFTMAEIGSEEDQDEA
jgi:DnaK suppressor protein